MRCLPLLLVAGSLALPGPAGAALRLRVRTVELPPRRALLEAPPSPDGRYVAAFDARVTASLRATLADAGVAVEAYVPDDALLVHVPPRAMPALLARPDLRALLALAPSDRVSPRVGESPWPDEPGLAAILTVQGAPGADLAAIAAAAAPLTGGKLLGARAGGTWPRLTVRVPRGRERAAALALAALPGVVWVEPAGRVRWLNDTSVWVGQSWDAVGFATPVHDRGLLGEGEIVGVSDTGLDADHASFYDAAQGLPGESVNLLQRKVIAYHDRRRDGNWDTFGHGTHVAGTVAGDLDGDGRWDANGPAQAPDGMAPAARLAVSDADDTDLPGNPIDLRELFLETYADGARLHTNSWGSCSCNEYTVHSQDVDDFLFANPDMTVVFAAGNSGPGPATVISPGSAKDCITVGATRRADAADALAGFSSRGPTDDGRRKPTVTAPGVQIRSAQGDGDIASFNDGVVAFSGTSMATPTATGLATLVREYLVKGWYPDGAPDPADAIPAPSAALLKALLVNSGRSMAGEPPAPSDPQGWGRILLDDVLHFAGERRRLWLRDERRGLAGPGEERSFRLLVGSAPERLEVTLAWTDPPAATLAGPKLVNDLDLVVTAPDGTVWLGNVYAGELSQPGGAPDRVNVEEAVNVDAPIPGAWTVAVRGANVPWGPQPFALVATGDVGPAPDLGYAAHALADPDGDGDGVAEPGELVQVGVTLAEEGGAPATGIAARLVPLVPWARVVFSDVRGFADVAALGTTGARFPWRVAIAPDAPCGEPLPFRLAVTSAAGPGEDGFALATGGDAASVDLLLEDGFDALAPGAPPDPARWRAGFAQPPAPGTLLRVEADATVEPASTPAASPPNALYVGRAAGGAEPSASFVETLPLDLSGHDRATLSFRYWVRRLEGGRADRDRLAVTASTDGGASFPDLLYTSPDYVSGMDSASYAEPRWHDVAIPLHPAGLLAPRLVLRFAAEVNADEPADAVYLDDVRVEARRVACAPGCVPPVFTPVALAPVCAGSDSELAATVLAEGFGPFAGEWDFGDATSAPVAALDEIVAHRYPTGGAWTATLTARSLADPACARAAPVTAEVDLPPELAPRASSPLCASDPAATVRASVLAPGHGPMTYAWDFGDGSPPEPAADPALPVPHLYPSLPATWTGSLAAASARVPGCTALRPFVVDVVAAVPTAGAVGNALRATRAGGRVALEWPQGALVPRAYNVHRTDRKERLEETAAVLGAEPVVASPADEERAEDAPPAAPLWHYEAVGRERCSGASELP